MSRNRTKNQLALTPMRIPKIRASWRFPRGHMASMVGRDVLAASVAVQSRGAEGVGDGRRGVAHEQRALQAQRHAFDDAPRAGLERLGVGELVLELPHALIEPRVGT